LAQSLGHGLVADLRRIEIEDIEERLGGHQRELAQRLAVQAGGEDRSTTVEDCSGRFRGGELGLLVLIDAGLLL
jgi:hypothetical protein